MFDKLSLTSLGRAFSSASFKLSIVHRFFHLLSLPPSPHPPVFTSSMDVSKSAVDVKDSSERDKSLYYPPLPRGRREKRATLVNKFLVKLVPINRIKRTESKA